MKARIGGWCVGLDVVRDLASNPHRVEIILQADHADGRRIGWQWDLPAVDAAALAVLLDDVAHDVERAADADTCDRCPMPCDPGELLCPTCEDAR